MFTPDDATTSGNNNRPQEARENNLIDQAGNLIDQAGNLIDTTYSNVTNYLSPYAKSLGITGPLRQPDPLNNPKNMGPSVPQSSLPPLAVPPLLEEEPLDTEMPEDFRGHTIEELSKLTTPLPPPTSIFARGGFVDKPLYSRS